MPDPPTGGARPPGPLRALLAGAAGELLSRRRSGDAAEARLEAELLYGEASGLDRAQVIAHGAGPPSAEAWPRFRELRARRLGEFVARYGGANDQLFGGSSRTNRVQAELSLDTDAGRDDYRFALAHAHPDRFVFAEEAFRSGRQNFPFPTEAQWRPLGVGHEEARIVEAAQTGQPDSINRKTASVVVRVLRNCAAFQFHDTSDSSNFKRSWDVGDNNSLRPDGGDLAAVLYRLEQKDVGRFEQICRHIWLDDSFTTGELWQKNLIGGRP